MKTQRKNTIFSIVRHFVAILCGLVLPREILAHYGSEMNGLVHSISQFLSYTVLLELGLGAVIQASLYTPLATKDNNSISAILSSGYKVYKRIALICFVYVLILFFLFPKLSGVSISALLVIVLGIGTISSYLVGTPERLLVLSDQKGYVVYCLGAVANIISTVIQVFLIRSGSSLVTVKLIGTIMTIVQSIYICIYARNHYTIDRKIKYEEEPISQKWNGIAQHVAYYILENTDIVLLTLFTSFGEVSVYSVYYLVISGVRRIFLSVTNSIQPAIGKIWAKNDPEELKRFFTKFERWIHISTVVAFGGMGVFLVPFVKVYTNDINDGVDYIRPLFAILLTAAYGIQSIRDPYDKLILASGHFKETQSSYIIAACLNLGISLIAVKYWGLEGVALGTLAAMIFQMIYMAVYDTKVLLKRSGWIFVKWILIDVVLLIIIILLFEYIKVPVEKIIYFILEFRGHNI